ncbi:hypothetical protein L249_1995 [Ophiocordyceps polyrhachis-furcata BCC 54312]|uniref:Histone H2A/H2B/H3 domain-containing protein n=1 Tax=Ophiocordyceps polyrhachis-furcata BCC 54312 TaxID=1330021 RepID=A0A367LSA7_9HYPO|nr:hypothetical protein L249_1995 [Ophiocordyceps polyrhachis-furcata BCC 54312]
MAVVRSYTYVTGGIRGMPLPHLSCLIAMARRALARAPLVIPRSIFARIAREMLHDLQRSDLRFEVLAIHALQDAAEHMLIVMFSALRAIARNGRREVVRPQDLVVLLDTLSTFKRLLIQPFSASMVALPGHKHIG